MKNLTNAQIEDVLLKNSSLYTSYGVKDKEGKFRRVVDVESAIKTIRTILGQDDEVDETPYCTCPEPHADVFNEICCICHKSIKQS